MISRRRLLYKNNIWKNAGDIFCLLADNGELNISEIGELTHYNEVSIFLALGWLAREDKIRFFEKAGEMFISLKNCCSEIYF
jgi:hypothetical protein